RPQPLFAQRLLHLLLAWRRRGGYPELARSRAPGGLRGRLRRERRDGRAMEEMVRNLLQEARRRVVRDAAEERTAVCVRHVDLLLRSGQPDVAEPPLLL